MVYEYDNTDLGQTLPSAVAFQIDQRLVNRDFALIRDRKSLTEGFGAAQPPRGSLLWGRFGRLRPLNLPPKDRTRRSQTRTLRMVT